MSYNLKYIFILLSLVFSKPFLFGQNRTIDSLKLALNNAKHDTTRCYILNEIIEAENDDAIWPKYNEQLLSLSKKNIYGNSSFKNTYFKYLANAYNNNGLLARNHADIPIALKYHYQSMKIRELIGDKKGISESLSNIAVIYNDRGSVSKALEYHNKSLKINEAINNKYGIAYTFVYLGSIYKNQNDAPKALEYYYKSLKICEEINDNPGIAQALNAIGLAYYFLQNNSKALYNYNKCLKIQEEISDTNGASETLNNIGLIYSEQGDFKKSLDYYHKCLKIKESTGDKNSQQVILNNIGTVYLNQRNYNEALYFFLKSQVLANEIAYPENIKSVASKLYDIYKATGNYKLALENYELYIQMRDSLNNSEIRKSTIKTELKYEYEKKAAADSVRVAEEKKLTTVKLKQEQTQRYFLYGGLGLTALFGIFMFNRFRVTKKHKNVIEEQKLIVEKQKHIVDEKQKEILDSIRYAKRIQQSLLPTEKYINRNLKKQ